GSTVLRGRGLRLGPGRRGLACGIRQGAVPAPPIVTGLRSGALGTRGTCGGRIVVLRTYDHRHCPGAPKIEADTASVHDGGLERGALVVRVLLHPVSARDDEGIALADGGGHVLSETPPRFHLDPLGLAVRPFALLRSEEHTS